jgi:integrase
MGRSSRVPEISLHHFRYNWASHLYASGLVTIEQVSRWIGHKDVRTTEIYLRIVDPRLIPSSKLPF